MGVDIIVLFEPYIEFFVKLLVLIINVVFIMKATKGNGVSITSLVILNIVIAVITNSIAFVIPSLDGIIQQDIISLLIEKILEWI